jgi:hypothetical protein
MSRLAFAILGLTVAVGAVASRAQSGIEIDCPGTVQSLAVTNPELHCTCPNACVNCHPSCLQGSSTSSGSSASSSSSHTSGLTPGQSAEVQVFGSLLDSLVDSILSNKKSDTSQIEQQLAEEQARQKQAQAIALAEWKSQQNKAAKNHQLEQEQRLQQGDALLKEMHGGESSTSAESPGGKFGGFRWDTPSNDKTMFTSLSTGRYDTSGLKSVQRLACAADFSRKAQAVQGSNPEQARFFNEQADRVTAGEAVEVACSFPPMPAVPEPVVSAQMLQTEKNIQTVQLDIKELQGIDTKVQKVQTDKSAAQEKVQQAEAARQQVETDKASAKPDDATLMAEIMRRQAEAQAQLDDANQKLKALSDQEQELSERKDAIRQELQQIQQQNRSGGTDLPH